MWGIVSGQNHDIGQFHSVNLILLDALSTALCQDLMMLPSYGVVNFSYLFKNGVQLDLGESRSPT